jgi:hypothetical protein
VADTVVVDGVDQEVVDALPWPEGWMGAVAASPMTGTWGTDRPLVVDGDLLYTQRMWDFQSRLADRLLARAAHPADEPTPAWPSCWAGPSTARTACRWRRRRWRSPAG